MASLAEDFPQEEEVTTPIEVQEQGATTTMAPQEQGSTQRATQEKKERNLKTSLVNTGVLPAVVLFEEDERQAITKGLRHAIEQEQEQGTTQEKELSLIHI